MFLFVLGSLAVQCGSVVRLHRLLCLDLLVSFEFRYCSIGVACVIF